LFQLFVHIEDDGTDGAIRESLIHPEDEFSFVQMWVGTTVTRPMVVNRAEVILQEGTRQIPENRTFLLWVIDEKSGTKLIETQPYMLGKTFDIRRRQNRMDRFAAICAPGAVDLLRYFPIEFMDCNINFTDRKIRSLEKAPECPVGLLEFLREFLNPLNVGFESHKSENQTPRFTESLFWGRCGSRLFKSLTFLFRFTQYIHDGQNVNLV
jgi:hypothetical protein